MEILYLLIPLSTLMVLAILGVFAWALHGGQFDELELEGERILSEGAESSDNSAANLDFNQAPLAAAAEKSSPEQRRP